MSAKCEFCGKVVFMSAFGLTCLECAELRIKHEREEEKNRLRAALERIIKDMDTVNHMPVSEGGAKVNLIERLMDGCVYRSGYREEMSPVHEDKTDELIFDATERIMKLEAALERIRDFKLGWRGTNAHEDVEKLQKIAREALE